MVAGISLHGHIALISRSDREHHHHSLTSDEARTLAEALQAAADLLDAGPAAAVVGEWVSSDAPDDDIARAVARRKQ